MSLLDNLPHTATAKTRRRTRDAMGGSKDSYPTTLFSGRACWRQPATDRQVNYWRQRGIDVTHNVYFAADPGLGEHHVLEISGDLLEVVGASHPDASCGLGVVWRVLVNLIGSA